MTITITAEARQAISDLLARDPTRPVLRLSFAGGCGALGYRLAPSPAGLISGEQEIVVAGLTIYADFKAASDLDGARIEVGESPDEIVVVHERGIVGGFC
jgi:Fe-S cluster assembly iron-binding protein IscA